jgi:transaldolase
MLIENLMTREVGFMKIFIDTANLNEIRKAKALGLVDGVTTNPTLLAKEGEETEALIRKIIEEVKGPVNVEVTGMTCGEMVKEAKVMATYFSFQPARPFWLPKAERPMFVHFWGDWMISVSTASI